MTDAEWIAELEAEVQRLSAELEKTSAEEDRLRRMWKWLEGSPRKECVACHLTFSASMVTRSGLCINCADAEIKRLRDVYKATAELLAIREEQLQEEIMPAETTDDWWTTGTAVPKGGREAL